MTKYVVHGMQWGVMKVKHDGHWLLLDSSIRDNPLDAIDAAEAEYRLTWSSLQNKDFYLVRLNRADDGSPIDLMYAWGQIGAPSVVDIRPYDDAFEKLNNIVVRTDA